MFGANAAAHLRAQHAALTPSIKDESAEQRERLTSQLSDIDQRIERQLAAIESGVDLVLVGERIRALKAEREQTETALATLDLEQRQRTVLDLEDACAVLDSLPDFGKPLAKADPELRRQVYEAFHFAVELDRNKPEVRLKARLSSTASDLDDFASMVANKAIAGERSALTGDRSVPVSTGRSVAQLTGRRVSPSRHLSRWSLPAPQIGVSVRCVGARAATFVAARWNALAWAGGAHTR